MIGFRGGNFGGPIAMLLLVAAAALVCGIVVLLVGRRAGWHRAIPAGLLALSVICLFVITLTPTSSATPGIRFSEVCSFDYDGPAPDGFYFLSGGQRFLNTAIFAPSGFLLVWTLSRFRYGLALVVPGLLGLAVCSVVIELIQQMASRLGRACDITDVVDNSFGALIGTIAGLIAVGLWRLFRRLTAP